MNNTYKKNWPINRSPTLQTVFLFPALLLLAIVAIIFFNRSLDYFSKKARYFEAYITSELNFMDRRDGAYYRIAGLNDLETYRGIPYIWGRAEPSELKFKLDISCDLLLKIIVTSPLFKQQCMTVYINGEKCAEYEFSSTCTDTDLLCSNDRHSFVIPFFAQKGINTISLSFAHAFAADDSSVDSRTFTVAFLDLRLVPRLSFLDKAISVILHPIYTPDQKLSIYDSKL